MGNNPVWGRRTPDANAAIWPKDEAGEPVAPVFLLHAAEFDLEASMTAGMLEAFGIPTLRRYPNDGEFGNIILGVPACGVDIYVPETMLVEARGVLSAEICEGNE